MKSTLITHSTVVTLNPQGEVIKDGAVYVEDGRIAWIGPVQELPPVQADEHVDAHDRIVLPGLINAHTHSAYYIMRGVGMDRNLLEWLQETVWPWLIEMDEKDVYLASMLGYVECIKSGTTALIDNQNYPVYHKNHHDTVAQAALDSNLRVTLACGFSDVRFVSPPDFVDTPDEIEAEVSRMIDRWHGVDRLQVAVSPINILYCSEEVIRRAVHVAQEKDVIIHTHVAESKEERDALLEHFGKGYLHVFHDLGALSPAFHSVHSVWLSDEEIELLGQARGTAVYNPTANMLLASGIAPVRKLQEAGVNVALGTDNPNNNNDMLEAMKFGSLLQKVGGDPLAAPAIDVLHMATTHGARALGMEQEIGSLEVGKQADIILVDTLRPHNVPMHDPVATLVYSAQGQDVTDVMVAGEILMRDSQITFIAEHELLNEIQARSEALSERVRAKRN